MSVLLHSAEGVRSFFKWLRGPIQASGSDVVLHLMDRLSGAIARKASVGPLESPRAMVSRVRISEAKKRVDAGVSMGCQPSVCKS